MEVSVTAHWDIGEIEMRTTACAKNCVNAIATFQVSSARIAHEREFLLGSVFIAYGRRKIKDQGNRLHYLS